MAFFDGVVGNPPYQNSTANTSDKAVYHEFLKAAYNEKLTKHASLIHPARFLSGAGTIPGDFIENFLRNEHIRLVDYFPRSQEVFTTSDIKGGVAITEFDATKTFKPIGTFIPFDELRAIHQKAVVDNPNFETLSEIVYPPEIYHFTKKFHEDNPNAAKILSDGHANDLTTNIFDKLPKIFLDAKPDDGREYVQVYGLSKKNRTFKWIRRDWITEHKSFDKFKVFLPKSNGSGALGEVLSNPIVSLPLAGCTQTFITVGAFDTEAEAQACLAYIKSKFCRALLGILKVTQHNPPQTWSKVPLQDFTSASDIDWSLSIPEIDAKLYRKYGLTAEEREFIESHVKAMT